MLSSKAVLENGPSQLPLSAPADALAVIPFAVHLSNRLTQLFLPPHIHSYHQSLPSFRQEPCDLVGFCLMPESLPLLTHRQHLIGPICPLESETWCLVVRRLFCLIWA